MRLFLFGLRVYSSLSQSATQAGILNYSTKLTLPSKPAAPQLRCNKKNIRMHYIKKDYTTRLKMAQ